MASISSAGLGSGLNVEDIISKLMALEQKPVTQLQTQATTIQTKISAYGQVQSALSTFRDAAAKLAQTSSWSAATATSADPSSVAVASGSGAVVGNYAIAVQSLASSQSVSSKTYTSDSALVGEGALRIELGSFGQSFTPQPNLDAANINISATDTVATVRDKINAAGAGVSAVIINDVTGARLVISSTATGASNGFRIQATDGDGDNGNTDGVSAFAFDPSEGVAAMTQNQAGADAVATVNGLQITTASNTWSEVIPGVTVNLQKTTAANAPIQIGVAQDNTTLKKNVQDFVDAYNTMAKLLVSQTKYDEATKSAGKLQGDSTAVSLARQLRNALTGESPASSTFPSLRAIGLEAQADGTIKVNDTKLTSALGNVTELRRMFTTSNFTDQDQEGIAMRMRRLADAMLDSEGAVTTRTSGLNSSLTLNKKRQDEISTRLGLTETRLRAQYSALDTQMANLTSLNNYITKQVAAWNKSS